MKISFLRLNLVSTFSGEDQSFLQKKRTNIPKSPKKPHQICYDIGYQYGICSTKIVLGMSCKSENDVSIPESCRYVDMTEKGIDAGVREVYNILNIE